VALVLVALVLEALVALVLEALEQADRLATSACRNHLRHTRPVRLRTIML